MTTTATDAVTRERIAEIEPVIRPYIRRTPVMKVAGGDFRLEADQLALKFESFQHSGSFKARGAFTNLLTRDIPAAGVAAASGGNHGAAGAYAGVGAGRP